MSHLKLLSCKPKPLACFTYGVLLVWAIDGYDDANCQHSVWARFVKCPQDIWASIEIWIVDDGNISLAMRMNTRNALFLLLCISKAKTSKFENGSMKEGNNNNAEMDYIYSTLKKIHGDEHLHKLLTTTNAGTPLLIEITSAVVWIARTQYLFTFIFIVKMVVICYLFSWIYVPFSKEYNLQFYTFNYTLLQ